MGGGSVPDTDLSHERLLVLVKYNHARLYITLSSGGAAHPRTA